MSAIGRGAGDASSQNARASSTSSSTAPKAKFSSLNLNKVFNPTPKPASAGGVTRYGTGLQVLGKVGAGRTGKPAIAAPKPVSLPSRKRENAGLDPNVNLVPSGGLGWGAPSATKEEGDEPQQHAPQQAPQHSSAPLSQAEAARRAQFFQPNFQSDDGPASDAQPSPPVSRWGQATGGLGSGSGSASSAGMGADRGSLSSRDFPTLGDKPGEGGLRSQSGEGWRDRPEGGFGRDPYARPSPGPGYDRGDYRGGARPDQGRPYSRDRFEQPAGARYGPGPNGAYGRQSVSPYGAREFGGDRRVDPSGGFGDRDARSASEPPVSRPVTVRPEDIAAMGELAKRPRGEDWSQDQEMDFSESITFDDDDKPAVKGAADKSRDRERDRDARPPERHDVREPAEARHGTAHAADRDGGYRDRDREWHDRRQSYPPHGRPEDDYGRDYDRRYGDRDYPRDERGRGPPPPRDYPPYERPGDRGQQRWHGDDARSGGRGPYGDDQRDYPGADRHGPAGYRRDYPEADYRDRDRERPPAHDGRDMRDSRDYRDYRDYRDHPHQQQQQQMRLMTRDQGDNKYGAISIQSRPKDGTEPKQGGDLTPQQQHEQELAARAAAEAKAKAAALAAAQSKPSDRLVVLSKDGRDQRQKRQNSEEGVADKKDEQEAGVPKSPSPAGALPVPVQPVAQQQAASKAADQQAGAGGAQPRKEAWNNIGPVTRVDLRQELAAARTKEIDRSAKKEAMAAAALAAQLAEQAAKAEAAKAEAQAKAATDSAGVAGSEESHVAYMPEGAHDDRSRDYGRGRDNRDRGDRYGERFDRDRRGRDEGRFEGGRRRDRESESSTGAPAQEDARGARGPRPERRSGPLVVRLPGGKSASVRPADDAKPAEEQEVAGAEREGNRSQRERREKQPKERDGQDRRDRDRKGKDQREGQQQGAQRGGQERGGRQRRVSEGDDDLLLQADTAALLNAPDPLRAGVVAVEELPSSVLGAADEEFGEFTTVVSKQDKRKQKEIEEQKRRQEEKRERRKKEREERRDRGRGGAAGEQDKTDDDSGLSDEGDQSQEPRVRVPGSGDKGKEPAPVVNAWVRPPRVVEDKKEEPKSPVMGGHKGGEKSTPRKGGKDDSKTDSDAGASPRLQGQGRLDALGRSPLSRAQDSMGARTPGARKDSVSELSEAPIPSGILDEPTTPGESIAAKTMIAARAAWDAGAGTADDKAKADHKGAASASEAIGGTARTMLSQNDTIGFGAAQPTSNAFGPIGMTAAVGRTGATSTATAENQNDGLNLAQASETPMAAATVDAMRQAWQYTQPVDQYLQQASVFSSGTSGMSPMLVYGPTSYLGFGGGPFMPSAAAAQAVRRGQPGAGQASGVAQGGVADWTKSAVGTAPGAKYVGTASQAQGAAAGGDDASRGESGAVESGTGAQASSTTQTHQQQQQQAQAQANAAAAAWPTFALPGMDPMYPYLMYQMAAVQQGQTANAPGAIGVRGTYGQYTPFQPSPMDFYAQNPFAAAMMMSNPKAAAAAAAAYNRNAMAGYQQQSQVRGGRAQQGAVGSAAVAGAGAAVAGGAGAKVAGATGDSSLASGSLPMAQTQTGASSTTGTSAGATPSPSLASTKGIDVTAPPFNPTPGAGQMRPAAAMGYRPPTTTAQQQASGTFVGARPFVPQPSRPAQIQAMQGVLAPGLVGPAMSGMVPPYALFKQQQYMQQALAAHQALQQQQLQSSATDAAAAEAVKKKLAEQHPSQHQSQQPSSQLPTAAATSAADAAQSAQAPSAASTASAPVVIGGGNVRTFVPQGSGQRRGNSGGANAAANAAPEHGKQVTGEAVAEGGKGGHRRGGSHSGKKEGPKQPKPQQPQQPQQQQQQAAAGEGAAPAGDAQSRGKDRKPGRGGGGGGGRGGSGRGSAGGATAAGESAGGSKPSTPAQEGAEGGAQSEGGADAPREKRERRRRGSGKKNAAGGERTEGDAQTGAAATGGSGAAAPSPAPVAAE